MYNFRDKIFTVIFVVVFNSVFVFSQQVHISSDLIKRMSEVDNKTMMPILIFSEEKKTSVSISISTGTLNKGQRWVENKDSMDMPILNYLQSFIHEGTVRGIQSSLDVNGVSCIATKGVIEILSKRQDIKEIIYDNNTSNNREYTSKNTKGGNSIKKAFTESPLEWGVDSIKAPLVWQMGVTGQNVLIAEIDDGVYFSHPDLSGQMWDGSGFWYNGYQLVNHGWDVWNGDNDPNPVDVQYNSHGTGVAGILVGNGSEGKQTGVAPGAKLMIIRDYLNAESNKGKIIEAINWLLDMKASDSTFPFPDIINISQAVRLQLAESYSLPVYDSMRVLFKRVFDKGAIVVAGSGNDGGSSTDKYLCNCQNYCNPGQIPYNIVLPACIPSPWIHPDQPSPLNTGAPDNHINAVIAVGNIRSDNSIDPTSSIGPFSWQRIRQDYSCQDSIRPEFWDYPNDTIDALPCNGPEPCDPENPIVISNNGLIKPDISAPGTNLYSTNANVAVSMYQDFSGTSSAAPHVAGALALVLSAKPCLKGNLPELAKIIQITAHHLGTSGKNNIYGAGRVDAYQAVMEALFSYPPCNPPILVSPTDNSFVSYPPTLRWNRTLDASVYKLQVSTSSSFMTTIIDTLVTDTLFIATGLSNTTKYYWRVASKNDEGESGWSASKYFTITPPSAPVLSAEVEHNGLHPKPTWTAVSGWGNVFYKLYRSLGGNYTLKYTGTNLSYTDTFYTIGEGDTYVYYYVVALSTLDSIPSAHSDTVEYRTDIESSKHGIAEKNIPKETMLFQAYPNPFNPSTEIQYALSKDAMVILKVYNVLGENVATLVNEIQEAGYKSVSFSAHNLPSGIYYYRFEAGNYIDMKKMLLLK